MNRVSHHAFMWDVSLSDKCTIKNVTRTFRNHLTIADVMRFLTFVYFKLLFFIYLYFTENWCNFFFFYSGGGGIYLQILLFLLLLHLDCLLDLNKWHRFFFLLSIQADKLDHLFPVAIFKGLECFSGSTFPECVYIYT